MWKVYDDGNNEDIQFWSEKLNFVFAFDSGKLKVDIFMEKYISVCIFI